MSATQLLSELRAKGVILEPNGDRLIIEAAPGIMTPELAARLKAFKPELLALLHNQPAANDSPADSFASGDALAYRWRVRFANREPLEISYTPGATRAEVLILNPEAVGAEPIPSKGDQWKPDSIPETEIPSPDLPLQAAIIEFDALIERLCHLSRYLPDVREEMRQARRRMQPGLVPAELAVVRELVKKAEEDEKAQRKRP